MNRQLGAISMRILFSIRRGATMTLHWITGLDTRQNPRLLFPSRIVLTLRLLSRFRPPANTVELENMDPVMAPLLSMLRASQVAAYFLP